MIRRRDIKAPDGSLYLQRWTLLRAFGFAIYLHRMVAPDYARELHDHPWPFATIVLKGGYVEFMRCQPPERPAPNVKRMGKYRHNNPGRVRLNGAHHMHRVARLPRGECWTLVLRGRRWRRWGFLTACGWMDWEKYVGRVYKGDPVCEDGEVAA